MSNRYFIAVFSIVLVTYAIYIKTREIALWREIEALRNAPKPKRNPFSHALPVDNDPRLHTPERKARLAQLREELNRNAIFKIASDLIQRSTDNEQ